MERERLTAFIRIIAQFICDRGRDAGFPIDEVTTVPWERASVPGLRMAARDFVEWCEDVSGDQLIALDAQLDAAGAPTLTAVREQGERLFHESKTRAGEPRDAKK